MTTDGLISQLVSAYYPIQFLIINWCLKKLDGPHHAFHLPGAAGAIPHKPGVIHFFICHLGFVTVLVIQIMALLALHQLVSHCDCHLP